MPTIQDVRTDSNLELADIAIAEDEDSPKQTISLNRDIYNVYVVLKIHNKWNEMKQENKHRYILLYMFITYFIQFLTYGLLVVEFWYSLEKQGRHSTKSVAITDYDFYPTFVTEFTAEEEGVLLLDQNPLLWCSKTMALVILAIYLTKDVSNFLTLIYCRDEILQQRFENLRCFIYAYGACMLPIYFMAMGLTVSLTMTSESGMLKSLHVISI